MLRRPKNKKGIVNLFLTGMVTAVLVSTGLAQVQGSESNLCVKEKAEEYLKSAFLANMAEVTRQAGIQIKAPSVSIYSVKPVNYGGINFCEVVFSFGHMVNTNETTPVMKNIAFYRPGLVILGHLYEISQNNTVSKSSFEVLQSLNKDYFEYIRKLAEKSQEEAFKKEYLKKLSLKEFERIKKKADAYLGPASSSNEVLAFVDPLCPHCTKMKETLRKIAGERKLKVYFVFTPILGPLSESITVDILCSVKDPAKRIELFTKDHKGNKVCEEGKKKIQENVDEFMKLGGRGVPYLIIKNSRNEVFLVEGAVSESILKSYFD